METGFGPYHESPSPVFLFLATSCFLRLRLNLFFCSGMWDSPYRVRMFSVRL